jgi:hypothetical protein
VESRVAVTQHWTLSRQGCVIVGRPSDIASVVHVLGLPSEAPVVVSPAISTLALWGEALERYLAAPQLSAGVSSEDR